MTEVTDEGERDRALLRQVIDAAGGQHRPGQDTMVHAVGHTLRHGETLLIQAGTGTGKSLGYLVPAMRFARDREARVVISTATLALQRQILLKDAPQVAAELDDAPEVALLKGWSNYLCVNKIYGGYPDDEALFSAEDFHVGSGGAGGSSRAATSVGREVVRLREWAEHTATGDRDDLDVGVSDAAWQQVSVDTRRCLGASCEYRSECFAAMARERATSAQVVVTNHSMLGIHASGANPICGEFDALIVDEAHDLVKTVRNQSAKRLTPSALGRRLGRVEKLTGVDVEGCVDAADAVAKVLDTVDDGLVTDRGDDLIAAMHHLDDRIRRLARAVKDSAAEMAVKTLAGAIVVEIAEFFDAWDCEPATMVTWVARAASDDVATVFCAPLNVSRSIADQLFDDTAVVLTSATLSAGGSFSHIEYETGVGLIENSAGQQVRRLDVGTPMNPARQGILYVARDLPAPTRSGISDEQLERFVELARAAGGGVLGLFSSRRAAEDGAEALRAALDVEVFAQGEDTVASLVRSFREDRDSCLVGTLSLWQGIDVRGSSCRLVVIDRIPFPVPTDPVIEARSRDATARGRNAFHDVSLSHAAILMSQAAGRLLRDVDDRGMVAVLDSRMATKSYGTYLRRTMPPLWPTEDTATALASLTRLRVSIEDNAG